MSIESVMLSNHLILYCPLLLLPSVFPSIKVFSSEVTLGIRWPKFWSFSFTISPSSEYSGLISFRIDWFDLLAVHGTRQDSMESSPTPQFESISSLVLNLVYGPTLTSIPDYWKNHSFDYTDLVGKVISLLFNTLFRFVIAFLWRRKCLLTLWLQLPSTVIFGAQENKPITVSTFPHLFAVKCWDKMRWS